MFQRITSIFSHRPQVGQDQPSLQAATELPSPPLPTGLRGKQITLPSFMRTARPSTEQALPAEDRRLANTDITTLRNGTSSRSIIRDFVRSSPDLSAAIGAYVRVGITSGYTAIAHNLDGTFNAEATAAVAQVITRMNILNDYAIGFDDSQSLRSVSETFARDLLMTGAMSGELVLDKARLPDKIQAISTSQIRLYPSKDGRKVRPVQEVSGEEFELDVPTFFMVSLDQDSLDAYPASPLEASIQATIFSADFMNDVRKIVKRAIHPRMTVVIDEERLLKMAPKEVLQDEQKWKEWQDRVLSDIESRVNGLNPEDALVVFKTFDIRVVDHGNTNLANEYKVIQEMIDAKASAGAKVMPVALGKQNSTSNTASSETLLFIKYVEGTVWAKLNEMFSKIFTLAARLLGHDVYVAFQYNAIDLRPDSELESFKALKQSRILEQLSLGLISDEEAAILLTGHLPPAGAPRLSGTGFRPNTSIQPAGNGLNGAAAPSNSGSTLNQRLQPETPTGGARGQNRQAQVLNLPTASGSGT